MTIESCKDCLVQSNCREVCDKLNVFMKHTNNSKCPKCESNLSLSNSYKNYQSRNIIICHECLFSFRVEKSDYSRFKGFENAHLLGFIEGSKRSLESGDSVRFYFKMGGSELFPIESIKPIYRKFMMLCNMYHNYGGNTFIKRG